MVKISNDYIIILDETELEDLTIDDEIVVKVDNEGIKDDWVKGQYNISKDQMIQLDDDGIIFESNWGEILEFDFYEIKRIYHIKREEDNNERELRKKVEEYLMIIFYLSGTILFLTILIIGVMS